jgi:hypothetical protein
MLIWLYCMVKITGGIKLLYFKFYRDVRMEKDTSMETCSYNKNQAMPITKFVSRVKPMFIHTKQSPVSYTYCNPSITVLKYKLKYTYLTNLKIGATEFCCCF